LFFKIGADAQKRSAVKNGGYIGKKMLKLQSMLDAALPEVQIEEIRRYCHARGWTITKEIIDHGYSGSSNNRPGLIKLLSLTHKRQIDLVVVVKLDRLFRSLKHLVVTLQEFSDLGVEFVSLKDQLDMTTASGRLLIHIIGAFAEFEKSLISDISTPSKKHPHFER
jgi:DNA invertase Pin-like site-specific DNA recombinase